ncbi:MAG: HD domain-containing phosphohydrolase [Pseudomonadota bacterium]
MEIANYIKKHYKWIFLLVSYLLVAFLIVTIREHELIGYFVYVVCLNTFLFIIVISTIFYKEKGFSLSVLGTALFFVPYFTFTWIKPSQDNAHEIVSIIASITLGFMILLYTKRNKQIRKESEDKLDKAERERILMALTALSDALGAKDDYTKQHSNQVAEIAAEFGRELGFNYRDITDLKYAGLLHDIGKIGIRDDILSKPAKLTEEEIEKISHHPQIATKILKHLQDFETVAEIILYHHEKYNGGGYPFGMSGRKIPILSQVLALADTFDALISKRSYKNAMTLDETISKMSVMADEKFEKAILQRFLQWARQRYRHE